MKKLKKNKWKFKEYTKDEIEEIEIKNKVRSAILILLGFAHVLQKGSEFFEYKGDDEDKSEKNPSKDDKLKNE